MTFKRKEIEKIKEQLDVIQNSLVNQEKKINDLIKVNDKQFTAYQNVFPSSHLQHNDAHKISECHIKEKSVLQDLKAQHKTLMLNFMKWKNEYGVLDHKLKIRDTIKDKYDKSETKILQAQEDKSSYKFKDQKA